MATNARIIQEGEYLSKDNRLQQLLKTISDWPDWKIKALILDESDLEVKKLVEEFRNCGSSRENLDLPEVPT